MNKKNYLVRGESYSDLQPKSKYWECRQRPLQSPHWSERREHPITGCLSPVDTHKPQLLHWNLKRHYRRRETVRARGPRSWSKIGSPRTDREAMSMILQQFSDLNKDNTHWYAGVEVDILSGPPPLENCRLLKAAEREMMSSTGMSSVVI